MRLFVDTNIILEYVEHRREYDIVRRVLSAIRDGHHEGLVSQGSIYTLAYLTEKALKRNGLNKPGLTIQLKRVMSAILKLVEPIGITRSAMLNAVVNESFTDIEDSFQYRCALENQCDVLITININDFKDAESQRIEILTPTEFAKSTWKNILTTNDKPDTNLS